MVRTKKADPVEVTHNVESCVCSDCKTRKLELEVIDLKARYADEHAHYDARLREVKDSMVHTITRMEARLSTNDDTLRKRFERDAQIATPERESLSRRIKLLEERVTDLENARSSKVVGDNTFETKVTQRLRSLEANRPIEISNRDAAAIARDIRKVNDHLERVVERLHPPF
jgi:hypothetical protein